jgi:hypothetical protein
MEIDIGLLKDETYGSDARHIYEASRRKLQYSLNKKLSLHIEPHTLPKPIRKMSFFDLVGFTSNLFYAIIFKNCILAPKRRDWLIFKHPRSKKIDSTYVDIYTDEIIDEIGIDKCVIIEKPYLRQHYIPTKYKVYYFEFIFILSKFIRPLTRYYFKYKLISINKMVNDINIYLERKFGYKILETTNIFDMKSIYAYYLSCLFLLRQLKPQKILLVVSYSYESLIWAAQTLNIPTVELQHGVITPEHLGYSVPVNMTKKLFPDYLLLFGTYWKETVDNLPLSSERLIIIGYPFFEKMLAKYGNLTKRKKQIIIISQGTIGNALSIFAIKLASISKDIYKIIYKLHPGEYDRGKVLYSELYEAREQGLLEIVDTDTPTLYALLAQSYWQIGVYSTAIFEGIALGCQTILVDLPGIEYMSPLLKKNIQLVKTPGEIQFNEVENSTSLCEELFSNDWRSNWHKFEEINLQCRFTALSKE